MAEEIIELAEKEFRELNEKEKWQLMQAIKSILQDLMIKAEKNCEKCEHNLLSVDDINIDLFFQDWRSCGEHCDECDLNASIIPTS